jgi:DNA-directed RNA polymerase subunit beta'
MQTGKKVVAKLKLLNSKQMRKWMEVKLPETINHRTYRPVKYGLFCEEIFGPINDYECSSSCKRYKGFKYDGIICERCNVMVSRSSVRRERMAYIELPVCVVHPWFFRTNNKIAALLDIQLKDLKAIVNLEKYIVFSPGKTTFKKGDLIKATDYEVFLCAENFEAETGANALKRLLEAIDLDWKIKESKELFEKTHSALLRKKYRSIVLLCEGMKEAQIRPEFMILDAIPVIPPDLRPLVEIEGGQFVSADINELYRTIIYRVNRLKALLKNGITAIRLVLDNEIRMIQDAVNKLFGVGNESDAKDGEKKYKSLEERLKGKEGSLRKFMLGKRADFSARSVIVVEPTLKLDECYLPKTMALELLKPVVIGYLRYYGFASSIKQGKRFIENLKPEIWDILNVIVNTTFPICLLNRAPTLHRIGIMAFKIKIWDRKAIGIPPLACPAFNADFDGDQMAVHLPLSEEAKAEAIMLMSHAKNLGSATDCNLTVGAFKDISLGMYVLTMTSDVDTNYYFSHISEINFALMNKQVELQDYISFLIMEEGKYKTYKTTPGRIILWDIIPGDSVPFEMINEPLNGAKVQNIMKKVRSALGDEELAKFADEIKTLGFQYANKYTGSIGRHDFIEVPGAKKQIDNNIKKQIELTNQLNEGLITKNEIRIKLDELWKQTQQFGEVALNKLMQANKKNPIFTIINSGARGSSRQLFQMFFAKGKVLGMDGETSNPIMNNHMEGIGLVDYFVSLHGIRKSCTDVALRTAEAGYLTRRLVDVAHDCVINKFDCGTRKFIIAKNIFKDGILQTLVYDKIFKRVAAADIKNPETGKVLIRKGTLITKMVVDMIQDCGITEVPIRSPVLCELGVGICANCYGGDLSTFDLEDPERNNDGLVCLGEAVGVIAAQSIGEPGTQLTMRSFHSGGVAKFGVMETATKTPFEGTVFFENERSIVNSSGETINLSRDFRIFVKNQYDMILADFQIPYGAKIFVRKNQKIEINGTLASWKLDQPIITEFKGKVKFINLIKGFNYEEISENISGTRRKLIVEYNVSPTLTLLNESGLEISYFLPIDTVLLAEEGDIIEAGSMLAYTRYKESSIDIVGGLQQVVNIFENRPSIKPAITSPSSGIVHISNDNKRGKNNVVITSEEGERHEIVITHGTLVVQNNQVIKAGDLITLGTPSMQDILDYMGINSLVEAFIKELQNVYLKQGIKINDKHLEVILHQMCRKYEVINSGGSLLLSGTVLDIIKVYEYNKKLSDGHKQQIETRKLITGITNTAIESTSFLSSASFQETINVLTNAGLVGAEDDFSGIKSCVIAGVLIRAGTGAAMRKFAELAAEDLLQTQGRIEEETRQISLLSN